MIYAKHNFAENILSADGTNLALDRDMVISELAKVINANPIGVKDAIFDCGINIDPSSTKFQISEVMSGNMANNECLQRSIGHLILDNNVGWKDMVATQNPDGTEIKDDEYSNAGGKNWAAFWKGTKDVLGSDQFAQVLGVSVAAVYQGSQNKKAYQQSEQIRQHELELAKLNSESINNQLSLNSMYGQNTPGADGGMSMGAKIGIGVGGLLVVGLLVFVIVRSKK